VITIIQTVHVLDVDPLFKRDEILRVMQLLVCEWVQRESDSAPTARVVPELVHDCLLTNEGRSSEFVMLSFIDSLPKKEEFRERIPMKRYGATEEIAEVISFLASEDAGYITGQNLQVYESITRSV
jgi:hypothetical protein